MADPTENTRMGSDPRNPVDPLRPADPAHTDEGLVPGSEHPEGQRAASVGGGSTAGAAVAPPKGRNVKGLVGAVAAVIVILLILLLLF